MAYKYIIPCIIGKVVIDDAAEIIEDIREALFPKGYVCSLNGADFEIHKIFDVP